MKNDWNEFKEYVNTGKHSPVPDHIWDNVKPYIPKAQNESGFFFIWFLSIMLLFSSLIFLTSNHRDSKLHSTDAISLINPSLNLENKASNTTEVKSQDEAFKNQHSEIQISNNFTSKNQWNKKSLVSNSSDLFSYTTTNLENTSTDEASILADQNIALEKRESFHVLSVSTPLAFPYTFDLHSIRLPSKNECYTFSKRPKNLFFIEAYAGPHFSPFSLSSVNAEFAENVKFRNASESSHIGISAGIRLGMQVGRFTFRIGGEYKSIYEKLKYQNNSDTDIIEVFKNSNLIRRDTIFGVRTVKIHNFHNLINLPISVGYDFQVGNHHFIPQVGISFNILARHKGALLDTLYRPQYFTSGNNPSNEIYKTQLGLSTFINLQYLVPITNKVSAYIEPGFEIFHSEFNKPAYPINQKYLSYKCNAGLRFNFY